MGLQYKPLYPWAGGLNTSVDPIILDPQNLITADNIIFTTSASRRKRGGQARYNTAAIAFSTVTNGVVYMADYWSMVSNVKRERVMVVTDGGRVGFNNPAGTSFTQLVSTTTLTVAHGGVTSAVLNNNWVLGLKDTNAVPRVWVGQNTAVNLVAMVPAGTTVLPFSRAWIISSFVERGFYAGNPALPDRLYVSDVGTYNKFTSGIVAGNSITLDVGIGDGDPEGITAVFPGTGGNRVLYVAKRRHLYVINCAAADQTTWTTTLISRQIGVINPNAVVTLDETDVIFMSDRGMHSLSQVMATTAIIPGEFLSFPIQYDYNSIVNSANRSQISLTYVPSLNSVLFSCKRVGSATYETVYGFNVILRQWFRWISTPCNFLLTRFNRTLGTDELYAGAPSGYMNKLNQEVLADFGAAITTTIKSSFIFPDGIPLKEYAFTRLIFVFRARDNSTFSVQYTIDGVSNDSFTVQQRSAGGNVLGTTLLGSTLILGNIQGVKPYFQHIAGVGSSIQLTITHNTVNKDFEMFGVVLEYEDSGDRQNPYNAAAYS